MATANVFGVPMCPDQDSAHITHLQIISIWHFDIFFKLKPPQPITGLFLPVWYNLRQYLHSVVSTDSVTFFFFAKAASTGFTALRFFPRFWVSSPYCSQRCLS